MEVHLARLLTLLDGAARKGLADRVTELETNVKTISEDVDDQKDTTKRTIGWLLGNLVLIIIALLGNLYHLISK